MTSTKHTILDIIRNSPDISPHLIAKHLRISRQAVHRHLRALKTEGLIEVSGRGPKARYRPKGLPDFSAVFGWAGPVHSPASAEMLCTSSDIFRGRLNRLTILPIPADTLPLLAAVLAEIGNNSFDHNLGLWRDDPGLWFELQDRPPFLWACLADRGQGVRSSLRRAGWEFPDDTEALKAAYEQPHLSGRLPEHRGNGLKFVRKVVLSGPGWGLACRSGQGLVAYGDLAALCLEILERSSPQVPGTLTLVCRRYVP